MSLTPPPKVQKLQAALHAKAKGSPGYRFYLLYDKVYRRDVLAFAYQCCLANGGAAGVDNQTFADIEKYGVGRWLDELAEELKKKTYRPQPVRRVYIPKPDGKRRPLTGRNMVWAEDEDRIERINRLLNGWANYFRLGSVSKAYRLIDQYTRHRLRQWLRAKHRLQGEEKSRFPDQYLEQRLGLIRLQGQTRNFSVGERMRP